MKRWQQRVFPQWKDTATDVSELFEPGLVMFIGRDTLWKDDMEKFADYKIITYCIPKWNYLQRLAERSHKTEWGKFNVTKCKAT